jgi:hypothetical protein
VQPADIGFIPQLRKFIDIGKVAATSVADFFHCQRGYRSVACLQRLRLNAKPVIICGLLHLKATLGLPPVSTEMNEFKTTIGIEVVNSLLFAISIRPMTE